MGWLEGLFHGIQATLFAQQMAARQQLENMRNQLPGRVHAPPRTGPAPTSEARALAMHPCRSDTGQQPPVVLRTRLAKTG